MGAAGGMLGVGGPGVGGGRALLDPCFPDHPCHATHPYFPPPPPFPARLFPYGIGSTLTPFPRLDVGTSNA